MDNPSLRGQLLVSNGGLFDPNFRQTVVLIVDHGEDGALGLVLNRPAPLTIGEAIPDLASLVGSEDHLYVGGPVQPEAAVVLAEYDEPEMPEGPLFGSIAVVGKIGPDAVQGIKRARVFGGYSGWAPGQLEEELGSNDWIVEDATAEDIFTDDPQHLWRVILQRKGGPFVMLSRMPFDPTTN
jgi:putative transcriptional regulator